jgi:HEAT repeats
MPRLRQGAAPAAAVVLASALLIGACHRKEPPASPPAPPLPSLGAIDVQVSAAADDKTPRLDGATLEKALRQHLLATGLFSPTGPPAKLGVRIHVEAVEAGAVGEARAEVELALDDGRADAADNLAFRLAGRGTSRYPAPGRGRKVPAATRGPLFAELVWRIARDLIDGYVARRQIQAGPPSAVHAALQADGGELREEAIRAVGARKLRDQAPMLLKLLDDPDEPTRDAALGALIALGDRRAVSELTRTRSLRDRREMRKIIEAISILGGQEADDYLSFVAATHDDDEIRAEAAAARARLARRENDAVAPRSE